MPAARIIAFYLPQFHPIPENDRWWGKGFTEWVNVAKAQPNFPGHYQPHVPADMGFYDLRVPETRQAQADLARKYGIEAFCYWHYWFEGRRLLERPFNEVLHSGEPDFPFCLAWANETWSSRWLGEEKDILLAQTYSEQDDINHVRWLLPAFADPRNVKIGNRPLFLVYRPEDLPNPQRTTDTFRNECIKEGLPEPFLLGIDAHCPRTDCRTLGFDGTLRFAPQLSLLPDFTDDHFRWSKLLRNLKFGVKSGTLKVYEDEFFRRQSEVSRPKYTHYPTVHVGWDNTPRRGRDAIMVINGTPERLGKALGSAIEYSQAKPAEERLVFVNAWNEWAEGNHLEPDKRFGLAFLEEVLAANTASGR